MLEDDDADAVELVEQLRLLPAAVAFDSELAALSDAIANYEFEDALAALQEFEAIAADT